MSRGRKKSPKKRGRKKSPKKPSEKISRGSPEFTLHWPEEMKAPSARTGSTIASSASPTSSNSSTIPSPSSSNSPSSSDTSPSTNFPFPSPVQPVVQIEDGPSKRPMFDFFVSNCTRDLLYHRTTLRTIFSDKSIQNKLNTWEGPQGNEHRKEIEEVYTASKLHTIKKGYKSSDKQKKAEDISRNVELNKRLLLVIAAWASDVSDDVSGNNTEQQQRLRLCEFLRVVSTVLFNYTISKNNLDSALQKLKRSFRVDDGILTVSDYKEAYHCSVQKVLLNHFAQEVSTLSEDIINRMTFSCARVSLLRFEASKESPAALKPIFSNSSFIQFDKMLETPDGSEEENEDERVYISPKHVWIPTWEGGRDADTDTIILPTIVEEEYTLSGDREKELRGAIDKYFDLPQHQDLVNIYKNQMEAIIDELKNAVADANAPSKEADNSAVVRHWFKADLSLNGDFGYIGRGLAPSKKARKLLHEYVRLKHPAGKHRITSCTKEFGSDIKTIESAIDQLTDEQKCLSGVHWKLKDFVGDHILGAGGYGVVTLSQWKANKGLPVNTLLKETVALKLEAMDESGMEDLDRSLDAMSVFHENLLPILAVFPVFPDEYTDAGAKKAVWNEDKPFVVATAMPLCKGGDLENYLAPLRQKYRGCARMGAVLPLMHQLLLVSEVLYKNRYVHRDLKPANCFFLHPNRLSLKVGDFGVARHVAKGDKITGEVGTKIYWPPESIVSGISWIDWDSMHDNYSIAVIIVELMCAWYLTGNTKNAYTYDNIRDKMGKRVNDKHGGNLLAELLRDMLSPEKAHRPAPFIVRQRFDIICDIYFKQFPEKWIAPQHDIDRMEKRRNAVG